MEIRLADSVKTSGSDPIPLFPHEKKKKKKKWVDIKAYNQAKSLIWL